MKLHRKISVICICFIFALMTGCSGEALVEILPTDVPTAAANPSDAPAKTTPDKTTVTEAPQGEAATAASSETVTYKTAVASGVKVKKNTAAIIDYSNTADGYVMVQYTADSTVRLKAQVKGPKTTYTYNIDPKKWATFPLSEGNGKYTVSIYKNVQGTKYSTVLSTSFQVIVKSEFEPFLYPNQYVDFASAPKSVAKAQELTKGMDDSLKKVDAIYDFVVKELTYDKKKAQTVKSGYLPVLDSTLESKTGICFDYAALMTGMLRSQDVPCKLVVGYTGNAYHAWINVWTKESGWIDGVIFFDGETWQRMDPTFASSGNRSDSIMKYIGNGTNYKEKYVY